MKSLPWTSFARLTRFAPLAFCAFCAISSVGCGHPATVQECDVIVERITELELAKRPAATDKRIVQQEVAETKKALHDQSMKDCVGRRITDRAMRCVREAKTSKQIIDECFD